MIEIKNLTKTFVAADGEVEALKNVSLTINNGDIYGIIGMSGAGKSRAADILEDMDYYCVDNMPAALLPKLAEFCLGMGGRYEKVALVTDSLDIAATDQVCGQFKGGTAFIVEDGVCKLPDRSAFAGSIATADRLVRVVRDACGFSIADAVHMITQVPATLLGLPKGSIKEGLDADLVVFDEQICVSDVFVGGIKRI